MCLSKLRISLFISLVWNLMRSNIMVSLKPTQCAVSTGKCSHLEFSNSSGEDGAAAGFQPRPLAQAGAAVPGHTVHSANSLSLPCPNDWQDFQNPGPGSSRFSCYIFLKKKKFSMEERFLLWKKKMELLFLQPRSLQEILSVNPLHS